MHSILLSFFLVLTLSATVAFSACPSRSPCSSPSLALFDDCELPRPVQAPDDCNCSHTYCPTVPASLKMQKCPSGWQHFYTGDGTVICIKIMDTQVPWREASKQCAGLYNSNLLNIREIERLAEATPDLTTDVMVWLSNETADMAHWSGLHLLGDKLYWDNGVPAPDQDLTSASPSIVKFLSSDWASMDMGRDCMSLNARLNSDRSLARISPEFCTAGYPFICSKILQRGEPKFEADSSSLCGDGWKASLGNGLCYKYNSEELTHTQAEEFCAAQEATLFDPRTIFSQMFAVSIMDSFIDGLKPVKIFTGMRRSSNGMITFNTRRDILLDQVQLSSVDIHDLPSPDKLCGVLVSPHFAEGRTSSGLIFFDSCERARPFLCSKKIKSRTTSTSELPAMSIQRTGDILNCTALNVHPNGQIVWKKDHQYFTRQTYDNVLELGSPQYKYMIGDNSDDSTVSHQQMAGYYQCEYWQVYPSQVFSSSELPVIFYDTVGVWMKTKLDGVTWEAAFESFNRQVSQNGELSPKVQRLKEVIQAKVQELIQDIVVEQDVAYDVIPLNIRKSTGNGVVVNYLLALTGPLIYDIQTPTIKESEQERQILEDLFQTINDSSLNYAAAEDGEAGLAGHLICLSKQLRHPETRENLTLPLWTGVGYHNDQTSQVIGHCGQEEKVMVMASCNYDTSRRNSEWSDITFTRCPTDCFVTEVTHADTDKVMNLPTATLGVQISLTGRCNGENTELFSAECTENDWVITEVPCEATCPAFALRHHMLPDAQPSIPVPLNHTLSVYGTCRGHNATFITSYCEGNAQDGGQWLQTKLLDCEPSCKNKTVTHPGTFEQWHLPITDISEPIMLNGMCNGVEVEMIVGECTLEDGGPRWDITYVECEAGCPETRYTYSSIIGLTIVFEEERIGFTSLKPVTCDGEVLYIAATCQGNLTHGGEWIITDVPRCAPKCPRRSFKHNDTGRFYDVIETSFGETYERTGICGGRSQAILSAKCGGNITTGVNWEVEYTPCIPQCPAQPFYYSHTNMTFTLPATPYGEQISFKGSCNNVSSVLVKANCTGDSVTGIPEWYLQTLTCHGTCPSVIFESEESGKQIMLGLGVLGERSVTMGLCRGEEYTEVEAVCEGNNADGGVWQYHVNSCGCHTAHFTHPQTMVRYTVEAAMFRETRIVKGDCHDQEMVMLNISCVSTEERGSHWSEPVYAKCETSKADQLGNLLNSFKDDPGALSSMAEDLSADMENATDEVVNLMVNIVQFIADPATPKNITDTGDSFVGIVSNMMNVNPDTLSSSSGEANSTGKPSTRLIHSVDSFLDSALLSSDKTEINQSLIAAEVWSPEKSSGDSTIGMSSKEAEITLSDEIAKGERIAFVKYSSRTLFSSKSVIMNDAVMSAKVSQKEVTDMNNAVNYKFKLSNDTDGKLLKCVYWDFEIDDWSSQGCQSANISKGAVTCTCNHLTNFAILVDQYPQEEYISEDHHLALSVITMVGLSVSIVSLTLVLISFMFIKKLRANQFQKVLANLSFSILATDVIFIVGIEQTANEIGCMAVAALLHYFIMASFSWMFVEAYLQHRRFVKVLNVHVEKLMLKTLPAWILPAVPVAIVFIIDPQLYKGGERFCWMATDALYYAFLLPVGCVIIANTILFTLLVRALTCARASANLRTNKSEGQMRRVYILAAIAVFSLLGLTWIFGYLVMSGGRLVFSYLFCIFNSFQGLVIFLLHNVRDPKVQNWWRSVLKMKPLKGTGISTQSYSLSSTKGSGVLDNKTHLQQDDKIGKFRANKNIYTSVESNGSGVPIINHMKTENTEATPKTDKRLELSNAMYTSVDSDASAVTITTNTSDLTPN